MTCTASGSDQPPERRAQHCSRPLVQRRTSLLLESAHSTSARPIATANSSPSTSDCRAANTVWAANNGRESATSRFVEPLSKTAESPAVAPVLLRRCGDAGVQLGDHASSATSASNGLGGCVESAAVRLHGRLESVTARRSHRRAGLAALPSAPSSARVAVVTAQSSTFTVLPFHLTLATLVSCIKLPTRSRVCDCAWRSAGLSRRHSSWSVSPPSALLQRQSLRCESGADKHASAVTNPTLVDESYIAFPLLCACAGSRVCSGRLEQPVGRSAATGPGSGWRGCTRGQTRTGAGH